MCTKKHLRFFLAATLQMNIGAALNSSGVKVRRRLRGSVMMLFMTCFMVCVLGDDTQAFKNLLTRLCSLNSVGEFASCCASYNIDASVTLASSAARNCFISSIKVKNNILSALFEIINLY